MTTRQFVRSFYKDAVLDFRTVNSFEGHLVRKEFNGKIISNGRPKTANAAWESAKEQILNEAK